jgi:20S proteasome alpha/beta subunit
MTPLGEGANQMHELLVEYVKAGFTRKEAMLVVLEILRSGMQQPAARGTIMTCSRSRDA